MRLPQRGVKRNMHSSLTKVMGLFIFFLVCLPLAKASEYVTKDEAYVQIMEWLNENAAVNGSSLGAVESELESPKVSLEFTKMKLAELERNLNTVKSQAQQNDYSIRSDSYSYIEYWDQGDEGNGGNPRLQFNQTLRFPVDSRTSVSALFNFQKGLGSNRYYSFAPINFSISTTLPNLADAAVRVGSFEVSYSPFILRNVTLKGHEVWGRKVYTGFKLGTSLFNLGLDGFLSRTRMGGANSKDGYQGGLRIVLPWEKPTTVNLTFFSDFTDPASGRADLAVKRVFLGGLDFATTVQLSQSELRLSGDLATSFLQEDARGGFAPQRQFAGMLKAEGMLRIPNFSPRRYQWLPLKGKLQYISPFYPTGYGAIRELASDFIYQYEEEPYSPDCPRNTWLLQLETGNILPARGVKFLASFDLIDELQPIFPRTQPRRFSHYYLNGTLQLGRFTRRWDDLAAVFDANVYNTKSRGPELYTGVREAQQIMFDTYLSVPDNHDLKVGLSSFRETSLSESEAVAWSQTVFGEAKFSLGRMNLTWRQYVPVQINDPDAIGSVQLTKVRANTRLGPGVSLNLRFDVFQEGAKLKRNLWLEMITGY